MKTSLIDLPEELRAIGKIEIQLPDNTTIKASLRHVQNFLDGKEPQSTFDYGKKPILNYRGDACFAELVILRLLLDYGWEGVWVETYGGTHYLRSMPHAWTLKSGHVSIPQDKQNLLQKIWKTAETTACFDVLAWHGDQLLFFEAKRRGKDKLTSAQIRFIKGALACGMPPTSLQIIEWEERP